MNRYFTQEVIQMANKYVKRYSISYIIEELQIKTMRYHSTPMAKMARI